MLIPGTEPFFMRGGPVGALVLHGFTGTPREVRPVGDVLAAEGLTVLGMRLPQHATQPSDMLHSHRRDWQAAALDGYLLLHDQCEKIFVMGLSTGGALAFWLAAQQPVAGVVAMSTPGLPMYHQLRPVLPWMWLLKWVRPAFKKKARPATLEPDHISYPAYPTVAVKQFALLLKDVDAVLPQVTCPALLLHSRADETVAPANMPHYFGRIDSRPKDMVWLQHSSHVMTKDREKELVFARIRAFVSQWR